MILDKYIIRELMKCANDIRYFAEKYIKINTYRKGMHSIVLNQYQLDVLEKFSKIGTFKDYSERQSGKTTIGQIILLHSALFKENQTCVAITIRQDNDIVRSISDMYNMLPSFMRFAASPTVNTKYRLEFDNGSKIFSTSTINELRGMGLNITYIDEFDFNPYISQIRQYLAPTMKHNKIFGLSTIMTPKSCWD